MEVFVGLMLGFVAFILGVFGFSQIIGTIKYPNAVRSPGVTICLWLGILITAIIVSHSLLGEYLAFIYIGLGISFFYALGVKPDAPKNENSTQSNVESRNSTNIYADLMTESDRDEIYKLERIIKDLKKSRRESLELLNTTSYEESKRLLEQGLITQQGYDSWVQGYQTAQFVVNTADSMIMEAKAQRAVIYKKYNIDIEK